MLFQFSANKIMSEGQTPEIPKEWLKRVEEQKKE